MEIGVYKNQHALKELLPLQVFKYFSTNLEIKFNGTTDKNYLKEIDSRKSLLMYLFYTPRHWMIDDIFMSRVCVSRSLIKNDYGK